jgi:hypothetical protein
VVPLVEENRALPIEQPLRLGVRDGTLGGIVKRVDGSCPASCGGGLADRFSAIESERRKAVEQLVELSVDDPWHVGRGNEVCTHATARYHYSRRSTTIFAV